MTKFFRRGKLDFADFSKNLKVKFKVSIINFSQQLPEFSFHPGNESIQQQQRSFDDVDSPIPTPTLYNDESVPDHRVTEHGIQLTDRGRYQVGFLLRQFDFIVWYTLVFRATYKYIFNLCLTEM